MYKLCDTKTEATEPFCELYIWRFQRILPVHDLLLYSNALEDLSYNGKVIFASIQKTKITVHSSM